MEIDEGESTTFLKKIKPFPRNSVNLLTGPTSSGKTFYVTHLLKHYHIYFQAPVKRIIFVLCNDRIEPVDLKFQQSENQTHPTVLQIPLVEFDPDQLLLPNDLVVIDDLQALTEGIRLTISVCAHHYNLTSLFIITHSLLGNKRHFELLTLCHRIFLFLKGTANVRLFKYLNSHFFQDPEIQLALKDIVPFCQRNNQVLALELNPLASHSDNLGILGLSHLPSLSELGYCLIYTLPQTVMEIVEEESRHNISIDSQVAENFSTHIHGLPKSALVVVSKEAVIASHIKPESEPKCSARQQWENTVEELEELIEANFKPSRWRDIKNLAKEILKNNAWCVYTDARHLQVKNKPKTKVSLLDFLGTVTRQGTTKEDPDKPEFKAFRPYVQELRRRGVSSTLLKNKLI